MSPLWAVLTQPTVAWLQHRVNRVFTMPECGFLSVGSLFPIVLWVSWTKSPLGFKARHFGGLSLQCWTQGLGCLMWAQIPQLLREKFHIFEISVVGFHSWGVFLGKTVYLCLSYLSQYGPLIFCCCGASQVLFKSFSKEIIPCIAVGWLCL